MQHKNRKKLESLSWFCHLCGMFSVFIGLSLTMLNVLNKNWINIQASLYILFSGYALVKISTKITNVLHSERIEV